MAGTTFKAIIDYWKKDGTANIRIRVTHLRIPRPVSTNLFATKDDITRSGKIKSQELIDRADEIIKRWRNIVLQLGLSANSMNVDEIIKYIQGNDKIEGFKLSFIDYGHHVADTKSQGTRQNYITALNALERYTKGNPIDISAITVPFLIGFEKFLSEEPVLKRSSKKGLVVTDQSKTGGRAISLYMECLRSIHNQAKFDYNNEDIGLINISLSPFKKYKIKQAPKSKKRAIEVEVIQAIINLEDEKTRTGKFGEIVRRDLARDCALISFALAGMNAADLYACPKQKFGKKEKVILYKREKTRTRRDDEAEMHIRIEPLVLPLIEKYADPTKERMFIFHKLYKNKKNFNKTLSEGLKRIESHLGTEKHFTFYSLRHSWATIARSKALNIDKYTVHEGLNHIDPAMKVTDIYIDRDWSNIWNANAAVLGLFDWSALLDREKKRNENKDDPAI